MPSKHKKLKILLFGDASNYHQALSVGLEQLGYDVTVASDGSRWMQTERNIDLSRHNNKLGGAMLWLKLKRILDSKLSGYDIVQLSGTGFIQLRPIRQQELFDRLKRNNGAIYITALATNSSYIKSCLSKDSPLRYSEWSLPGKDAPLTIKDASPWLTQEMCDYTDYIFNNVDGIVSALYEYDAVCRKTHPSTPVCYGGIPIVTSALPSLKAKGNCQKLRILYAAHKGREREKGADILLQLAERLAREYPNLIEIIKPENVPYRQFLGLLNSSDIVLDQLYSFTPATTALLAMAMGCIPVSGGEKEFYDFIGENKLRPIINANPCNLEQTYADLSSLIRSKEQFRQMSREGIEFVKRHNDCRIVAQRFIDFWTR